MLRSLMATPTGPNSPGLEQVDGRFMKSIWLDDETGVIYADTVAINTPGGGGAGTPGSPDLSVQFNNSGAFSGSKWLFNDDIGAGISVNDDSAGLDLDNAAGTAGFFAGAGNCGVFNPDGEIDLQFSPIVTDVAALAIVFSSDAYIPGSGALGIYIGIGDPESVLTANPGSLFLRSDGDASTSLYVKGANTDATGWAALGGGGGGGLTAPWSQTSATIQAADDGASITIANTADDVDASFTSGGFFVEDASGNSSTLGPASLAVKLQDNSKQFVVSMIDGVEVIGLELDLSGGTGIRDSVGSLGADTQLLSTTGSGVLWVDAAGAGFPTLNQVDDPTATKMFTFPKLANFIIAGTQPDSVSGAGSNAGTPLLLLGYAGGATTGTGTTGGIGSSSQFAFGDGGDASGGTDAKGGLGGSFAITTGNGGASSGAADNANAGDVVFQFGTAGTGGSGAAGRDGRCVVQGALEVDGALFDNADSSGAAGQFLSAGVAGGTMEWADPVAPGTPDGSVQFNSSGAFTGSRFLISSPGGGVQNFGTVLGGAGDDDLAIAIFNTAGTSGFAAGTTSGSFGFGMVGGDLTLNGTTLNLGGVGNFGDVATSGGGGTNPTWVMPSFRNIFTATQAAQTAAISDVTMETVAGGDKLYCFAGTVNFTTSVSLATATLNLKWTDTSNTAQTLSVTATGTTLGSASFSDMVQAIRAKNGTTITYGVTITGSPSYDVDVRLMAMA